MSTNQGIWSEVAIAGHACDSYQPPSPSEFGLTVLYLHGERQAKLRDHPPFVNELDRYGLRALCPAAGRSWWTDRICPEFDCEVSAEQFVVGSVARFLRDQWKAAPPQIALLGTGMGGQGALRMAYRHPEQFPIVAAIAPTIDFHRRLEEGDRWLSQMFGDPERARQDTATLHIHPLNWPRHQWFCCAPTDFVRHESAERLRMKLFSLGVPHECDLETSFGDDCWSYYEHMAPTAMAFLHDRLERERLRVV